MHSPARARFGAGPFGFPAHNPTPIRKAFLSDSLLRAPFTNRMDQFDAVTIDDTQQAGLDQEVIRPVLVGGEQPKQSSSIWQMGEEWLVR